jgi:hypothetical protein
MASPRGAFHACTNHSWESVRRGGRALDWRDKPHPYREYPRLEPKPLPPELDRLLRPGAGVVRTRHGYDFRSYSSAGALYPVEIYAATAAGLFSFHARDFAFVRLRSEDVRRALAEAAVAPELARAGAVLVLTGILWRTAWKYEARGYRHLSWDAGTMLANLLALEPATRVYTVWVPKTRFRRNSRFDSRPDGVPAHRAPSPDSLPRGPVPVLTYRGGLRGA